MSELNWTDPYAGLPAPPPAHVRQPVDEVASQVFIEGVSWEYGGDIVRLCARTLKAKGVHFISRDDFREILQGAIKHASRRREVEVNPLEVFRQAVLEQRSQWERMVSARGYTRSTGGAWSPKGTKVILQRGKA